MTLHIRAVPPPNQGRLRQLLLDSLPQLLGQEAQALPSTGQLPVDTLVAVDAYQRLWVVSFASQDPGRALLDGLGALQHVRNLLPWLRQARLVASEVAECSLLVLTPEIPAGAAELCARAGFDWRRLRFLEVNGELGLLVESGEGSSAQPQQRTRPQPGTLKSLGREEPPLSPEEEAFFQHL